MKIKIANNFWESSDIRYMREVKSILLFMARSKYRFRIENNIGDDTTEITFGNGSNREWINVVSYDEFYNQISKVSNEQQRFN